MQGYRKVRRLPQSPLTPTGNAVAVILAIVLLALIAWGR